MKIFRNIQKYIDNKYSHLFHIVIIITNSNYYNIYETLMQLSRNIFHTAVQLCKFEVDIQETIYIILT